MILLLFFLTHITHSQGTPCNPGWYLDTENSICIRNVCSCVDGTGLIKSGTGVGAFGSACPNHDDELCVSCSLGWTLYDGKCFINECNCHMGLPAISDLPVLGNCETDDSYQCESCDTGFKLADGTTIPVEERTCISMEVIDSNGASWPSWSPNFEDYNYTTLTSLSLSSTRMKKYYLNPSEPSATSDDVNNNKAYLYHMNYNPILLSYSITTSAKAMCIYGFNQLHPHLSPLTLGQLVPATAMNTLLSPNKPVGCTFDQTKIDVIATGNGKDSLLYYNNNEASAVLCDASKNKCIYAVRKYILIGGDLTTPPYASCSEVKDGIFETYTEILDEPT